MFHKMIIGSDKVPLAVYSIGECSPFLSELERSFFDGFLVDALLFLRVRLLLKGFVDFCWTIS